MAPVWVSLNVGIALLIDTALQTQRDRILAFAEWATRPEPQPGMDR
jgi:hypothetical protein